MEFSKYLERTDWSKGLFKSSDDVQLLSLQLFAYMQDVFELKDDKSPTANYIYYLKKYVTTQQVRF